jgi:hypothetical protein
LPVAPSAPRNPMAKAQCRNQGTVRSAQTRPLPYTARIPMLCQEDRHGHPEIAIPRHRAGKKPDDQAPQVENRARNLHRSGKNRSALQRAQGRRAVRTFKLVKIGITERSGNDITRIREDGIMDVGHWVAFPVYWLNGISGLRLPTSRILIKGLTITYTAISSESF